MVDRMKSWLSDGANLAKIVTAAILIAGIIYGGVVWAATRVSGMEMEVRVDKARTGLRVEMRTMRDDAVKLRRTETKAVEKRLEAQLQADKKELQVQMNYLIKSVDSLGVQLREMEKRLHR